MEKLIAITAFILLSLGAMAQEIAPAEMQNRLAAAGQLMLSIDMETQLNEAIHVAMEAEIQQNPQLEQFRPVMEAFFSKYFSYSTLKEPLLKMYAEAFTEQELQDLAAFYNTPTGRKAAKIQPELMQQSMLLGQQEVQKHLPELQQMVLEYMQGK